MFNPDRTAYRLGLGLHDDDRRRATAWRRRFGERAPRSRLPRLVQLIAAVIASGIAITRTK